ncbi:hypothetical protein IW261DRAFT_1610150 [Armillaria novae-zelandiae]|uniref:Uncharacterized protein n=1 Tax=Armillaria novae-zelandiae TaxID=153914 RepID=A0AA39P039_9AGAR|nr:hypothetical protein IW261DRAFT_1610150 [Armillaria novae-zelandiae]
MAPHQDNKLEYVLTLTSTAFSTSTSLYTLACTFAFCNLVIYPILPPLTVRAKIQHLEDTIHEVAILFSENTCVLADPVMVDIQINDIQAYICSLIRRLLYANASVSINFRSWFRYLSEIKAIWTDARKCQIEANRLKRKVKIAMIEEKEGRLREEVIRKRRSSTNRALAASFQYLPPSPSSAHP